MFISLSRNATDEVAVYRPIAATGSARRFIYIFFKFLPRTKLMYIALQYRQVYNNDHCEMVLRALIVDKLNENKNNHHPSERNIIIIIFIHALRNTTIDPLRDVFFAKRAHRFERLYVLISLRLLYIILFYLCITLHYYT